MDEQRPKAPLEWRSAGPIADVRFPERIVEIIAVPYEQDAAVQHQGRWIRETIQRGAFDGCEYRARRVRAYRDHDHTRGVGGCRALHPSREEGLVAEIHISRHPLGDETLEMAADGYLDASVGFAPMPGGEQYTENRTRRTITRAWLGHIAFTTEPAYEGANVLAVRNRVEPAPALVVAVPTPNLDRILDERRRRAYDAIH